MMLTLGKKWVMNNEEKKNKKQIKR